MSMSMKREVMAEAKAQGNRAKLLANATFARRHVRFGRGRDASIALSTSKMYYDAGCGARRRPSPPPPLLPDLRT